MREQISELQPPKGYREQQQLLPEEFGATGDPLGKEGSGWKGELHPKGKGL